MQEEAKKKLNTKERVGVDQMRRRGPYTVKLDGGEKAKRRKLTYNTYHTMYAHTRIAGLSSAVRKYPGLLKLPALVSLSYPCLAFSIRCR